MRRSLLVALLLCVASGVTTRAAEQSTLAPVTANERTALFRSIDVGATRSFALLEELVNRNSGTFNVAGVTQVGERLQREFVELGFSTRWVKMERNKNVWI